MDLKYVNTNQNIVGNDQKFIGKYRKPTGNSQGVDRKCTGSGPKMDPCGKICLM